MTEHHGPVGTLPGAIGFAAHAHQGQLCKSGFPYILHPLSVMRRVGLMLGPDDPRLATALIAAVLHDVVEDCDVHLSMIDAEWGPEVADLVDLLSRRDSETYDAFIERVIEAGDLPVIVKLCDMNDNLDPDRAVRLSAEQRDYFARKYLRHHARLVEALAP